MGKWSQVRCNCPNRVPLPNSSWCDRPYQNQTRKRLSSKQKQEIAAWENNIEGMYECGHRNGVLVELYPGKIIKLGLVIKEVFADDSLFEIYPQVGDWRNYFTQNLDEELQISPEAAELWLIEAIELERAFLGQGNIAYSKIQKIIAILFQREVKSHYAFEQCLESVAKMEFARIVPFLQNCDRASILPDSIEQQFAVIDDTIRLCKAGIQSGNPIELLW